MLLNYKDIRKLRTIIEERLERVPVGKRISIDNDILEQLLFETVYVINNEGKKEDRGCKFVAWSGPFLSKIDLSGISFDKVLWGYFGKCDEKFYCNFDRDTKIDLSHTNAKIDFSKSARNIYDGYNALVNCNFEKVDLSNTSLGTACLIINSNLRKANMHFENDTIAICENSNLSYNDFSNVTVSEYAFISEETGFGPFTNLKNTGLNIVTESNSDDMGDDYLKLSMSLGNLDGCYLDGEKINLDFRKRKENRTFIDEIDKQINKVKYLHRKGLV